MKINRRNFLKISGLLATAAGLGQYQDIFAAGLEKIAKNTVPVVWIEAQACSGCSISLLNNDNPGPLELLTEYISLVLHQTIGASQGHGFMEVLEKMQNQKDFVLVIEGSIPAGLPEACIIGGKKCDDIILPLARKASYIVGIGTCAAFGGIPAAEGNPTGAVDVRTYLENNGISPKNFLVNCPSCPTHPISTVGTLAYLAGKGYPEVDKKLLTPKMFYSRSTHDNCPKFHDYSKEKYAKKFGDEGCLFKLGCLGFLALTECPSRQWNGGANWCIRGGAPCIACSSDSFAKRKDFPFYRKGEKYHSVAYNETARKGE